MHPHLENIATLLSGFDEQSAFCGGWAIDLALNKVTRKHKDLDVAIFREHQLKLQTYLSSRGWSLEYAHNGKLYHWEQNQFLDLPIHTIWCKHENHEPDFLEILLNERDDSHFIFRRDARIKREVEKAFTESESGYKVLAPEIALLYKSNNIEHEGNSHDFEVGFEVLDDEKRQWLKDALYIIYGQHQWIEKL